MYCPELPQGLDWAQHTHVCGRHSDRNQEGRLIYKGPGGNIYEPPHLSNEIKPDHIFGVPAGKLLGYIISEIGIEANPEKINAIMSLKNLTSIRGSKKSPDASLLSAGS